jgi:tRNA(Ile)-lysidine synthase
VITDLADRLLARTTFPTAADPTAPDLAPPDPTGPTASGGATVRWALAVSGGPDSLALLVLAARAGLECTAIHVDHGLRPGSAAEAEQVAAAAARYGAGFESIRITVAPGPDLEARARRARYDALPPGVLTGHTMDDQAETVLIALLRGAGLDGLSGMRSRSSPGSPLPGRPLLGLRRRETAALCAAEGLTPVLDPTNADARFVRNRVRHEVLPLLADVAGRDLVPVLARQAELLADDAALLEHWAGAVNPTDARALGEAPVPLARRAVRRWLRAPAAQGDHEAHPPSAAEVARVLAVAEGAVVACEIAGGRRVWRHAGRLRVAGR